MMDENLFPIRKDPFSSNARVCKLCNSIIFTNDDWVAHFRFGDELHRSAYREAMKSIM